jgi:hypothetical protein
MDVFRFSEPIRRYPSAIAVTACVGKKDRIVICQQPSSVARHADPVVRDPVHQDDSISVGVLRLDEPRIEVCAVGCDDVDISKIVAATFGNGSRIALLAGSERAPWRMQG